MQDLKQIPDPPKMQPRLNLSGILLHLLIFLPTLTPSFQIDIFMGSADKKIIVVLIMQYETNQIRLYEFYILSPNS